MVGPNDEAVDPGYVPVQTSEDPWDPRVYRMEGTAIHGNTPFSVPFISEILPGFHQGGCEHGLKLPEDIVHVVSLYPWERYQLHEGVRSFTEMKMSDSSEGPDRTSLVEIATKVNECRADGPTLVHCQAGLNRSGLVAGVALVLEGRTPQEAINLLRESRSPAVLCNKTFEQWLLDFDPEVDPWASG